MARIGVVGGGIVGLACAYSLVQNGHAVTVIDRDPHGDKCSWGNAGGIAVSEVAPASMPGVLWRVPRWLADPLGPLSLRPTHAPWMVSWLRRFLAAGRPQRVAAIATALAALNGRAHADLAALLDAAGIGHALRHLGMLTVYETPEGVRADRSEWALKRQHGIVCLDVTGDEARALEPALGANVRHGVLAPDWWQVTDPREVWAAVLEAVIARGGAVMQQDVVGFDGGALRFATGERMGFDTVVIAAGAWSAELAARIGDRASLESERGYNTTLPRPGITLGRQVTFGEHKFVASPLSAGLRIGGAAEFAGLRAPANYARSGVLVTLARRYLPGLSADGGTVWMGNRPTTPDSLPVIGRSPHQGNVVYAFGHGHLGLTQAATTGRLVADIVAGRDSGIDLTPYSIARFG